MQTTTDRYIVKLSAQVCLVLVQMTCKVRLIAKHFAVCEKDEVWMMVF